MIHHQTLPVKVVWNYVFDQLYQDNNGVRLGGDNIILKDVRYSSYKSCPVPDANARPKTIIYGSSWNINESNIPVA